MKSHGEYERACQHPWLRIQRLHPLDPRDTLAGPGPRSDEGDAGNTLKERGNLAGMRRAGKGYSRAGSGLSIVTVGRVVTVPIVKVVITQQ